MAQTTSRKTYRTASGKELDMEAMLLHNEDSIAVGNNPVNARGDEIGPGGEIIKTSAEIVQEYYASNPNAVVKSQPVGVISEDLIPDSEREPKTISPAMSVEEQPTPEALTTPNKAPVRAKTAEEIIAETTTTADSETQSALEKKIATAKRKAADKAKKKKIEEDAKLPKAVTGGLDDLDLT
tara:strand:- start:52 stop:597 length:546 start_codon:yes stop_codon:yes gene_type:complete